MWFSACFSSCNWHWKIWKIEKLCSFKGKTYLSYLKKVKSNSQNFEKWRKAIWRSKISKLSINSWKSEYKSSRRYGHTDKLAVSDHWLDENNYNVCISVLIHCSCHFSEIIQRFIVWLWSIICLLLLSDLSKLSLFYSLTFLALLSYPTPQLLVT